MDEAVEAEKATFKKAMALPWVRVILTTEVPWKGYQSCRPVEKTF